LYMVNEDRINGGEHNENQEDDTSPVQYERRRLQELLERLEESKSRSSKSGSE
jgi:hypothetical protein